MIVQPLVEVLLWAPALVAALGPGWLLSAWLFKEESLMWHFAVGSTLGLTVTGGLALLLGFTPLGLTPVSLVASLIVLDALAAALAWRALRQAVLGLRSRREYEAVHTEEQTSRLRMRTQGVVTIGLLLAFLMIVPAAMRGSAQSFTEFYLLDTTNGLTPWRDTVLPNQPVSMSLVVASHEVTAQAFQVDVVSDGRIIQTLELGTVEPGSNAVKQVVLAPSGKDAALYELVLRQAGMDAPYRTLYFWIRSHV